MPYIPGSPIDAYCDQCKSDTSHVVLESYGTQIRLVRCERCETEGPFKTPRVKTRAALMELVERKSQTKKPVRRRRKPQSPEEVFALAISGRDMSASQKYSPKMQLEIGDIVEHPTFGHGVVTTITDPQKAHVCFEDGERVMVFNRG